ncbi:hypothetical protein HGG71_02210 [Rhodobacteraceae bacterium R_SAG2]|nr:hypothetical protein [Rhodobacteraceae bacterium R_SAG2]
MTRIFERDTDALFLKLFRTSPVFVANFLNAIKGTSAEAVRSVKNQTPHRGNGHSGTIDIELLLDDQTTLLIENKIDAGYSVTRIGVPQPHRYVASVAALQERGMKAASVLLAPKIYLNATRYADRFNHCVSYEALRKGLSGADANLLDAAILQASTPYDPVPNESSAAFFASYDAFVRTHFPMLVTKLNPNGNGVRPTGSHTIYFDVPRTLRAWADLPKPRMSLQCWDSGAPSASVKIMIGGWAAKATEMPVPSSLAEIGGYLRPAGRSLGIVIDTPQLDTQMPLEAQLSAVEEGLEAARRLVEWWNRDARALSSGAH